MSDRESRDDQDDVLGRIDAIIERTHAAVTAAIVEGLRDAESAAHCAERAVAAANAGAEEALRLAQASAAKILRAG